MVSSSSKNSLVWLFGVLSKWRLTSPTIEICPESDIKCSKNIANSKKNCAVVRPLVVDGGGW